MKVQVINTDFLHDGIYYKQNSIIDIPPELIEKYPHNLLAVDVPKETKEKETNSLMIQDNSDANNMLVPSGIVKTKKSKENKTR